jgi:hypothetical protein
LWPFEGPYASALMPPAEEKKKQVEGPWAHWGPLTLEAVAEPAWQVVGGGSDKKQLPCPAAGSLSRDWARNRERDYSDS